MHSSQVLPISLISPPPWWPLPSPCHQKAASWGLEEWKYDSTSKYTYAHVYIPAPTHTCMQACKHVHTRTWTHTHTHMHTRKHQCMKNIHTLAPARAHTHTHTHTHTHSLPKLQVLYIRIDISATCCEYNFKVWSITSHSLQIMTPSAGWYRSAYGKVFKPHLLSKLRT